MKQLIISVFCLTTLILGFSSCQKEYTCTCITTDPKGIFEPSESSKILQSAKKDDAEDICASSGSSTDFAETVCSLQ